LRQALNILIEAEIKTPEHCWLGCPLERISTIV